MKVTFTALDLVISYLAANGSTGNPDHWKAIEGLVKRVITLSDEEQKESGVFYPSSSVVGFTNVGRDSAQIETAVEKANSVSVEREVSIEDINLMSASIRGGGFERMLGLRAITTIEKLAELVDQIDAENKFNMLSERSKEKLLSSTLENKKAG